MQLFIKIIALFLIIFNFRIPIFYNSTILSIVLCTLYYLTVRKSIPFTYFFRRYNVTVFIGLLLYCFIIFFITVAHFAYEFTLLKVLILQFVMLFALVYALPLLIDADKPDAFEQAIAIICYAFALQGFIQLIAFYVPAVGDFMVNMKPLEYQEFFEKNPTLRFRGYSLTGSPFFELPCGFGVAFILFFRILHIENQQYITGYKKYIFFALIFWGSMLSGRTAFVGLGLGLLMTLFFTKKDSGAWLRVTQMGIILGIFFIIISNFFLSSDKERGVLGDIFSFAFEFYYNFEDRGDLGTTSSDALRGHYFPLPDETLLHGDGRYLTSDGGYYEGTDAGYMRMLLYGGIPFFICLLIYQYLYFKKPLFIARNGRQRSDRNDYICWLFLFLHLFILEYKSDTISNQNIMEVLLLFLGSSYMIRYYHKIS